MPTQNTDVVIDSHSIPQSPTGATHLARMADTTLVGRLSQIETITSALESVSTGQERVLLLTGEPGIGKSILIDETNRLATEENFSTITTRCPEQEGAPPFWLWTLALTQIAESFPELIDILTERNRTILSSIVPALAAEESPSSPTDSQFELFTIVANLVKRLAHDNPLIITIDDLHWADSSSLKLLEHIADNIEGTKILLLCAMRDTEFDIGNDLSSTLATLSRRPSTSRMPLNRLDQEASVELLTQTIDDSISSSLLEDIFSYAEGNPFYTLELARLQEQTNPDGESTQFTVPAGVRDVVSQRLNLLDDETRNILKQASVFGREFDVRLLGPASGLSALDALSQLEPAENMGVIAPMESATNFRFTHALMREVLLASLSLSERVRSHAKAAQAIENSDAHPDEQHANELAHHFKAAETITGAEPVVKYLIMAGHSAISRLAFQEAESHFREAQEFHGADKRDLIAAEILEWSAVVISTNGLLADGHRRVWEAFGIYDELGESRLAVRAATHPIPGVNPGSGDENQLRAIELSEPDTLERAVILSRFANLNVFVNPVDGWEKSVPYIEESLRITELLGAEGEQFWTLGRYLLACVNSLQLSKGIEIRDRALPLSKRSDELEALTHFHHWSGELNLLMGELDAANADADQATKYAKSSGRVFRIQQASNISVNCAWVAGSFRQVIDEKYEEGFVGLLGLQAHAFTATGDLNSAAEYEEKLFAAENRNPVLDRYYAVVRREFDTKKMLLTGTTPENWTVARDELIGFDIPYVAIVNVEALVGLFAAHSGDAQTARIQYDRILAVVGPYRSSFWGPFYATGTVLGKIAVGAGLINEANEHFSTAVQWTREHKYAVDLVVALAESAEFAAARNRLIDGKNPAQLSAEGAAAAEKIGMVSRNLTFEKFAGATGAAPKHPDGLTDREIEVLKELATGKSNREIAESLFITQNTVIRHVANIFAKTGSANRAQAAVYATQHDLQ